MLKKLPFSNLSACLPLVLLFSLSSPAFSDSVSTTGVQFLKIPAGVRGAGMGGMFTGVADDITTTYWNTAGLAQLGHPEFNLLHVSYFAGTNYEFGGFGLPLATGSVVGLSAAMDFVPSFNSTNNPAAIPGSASDLALSLGYGQTFGDNFALGIGGKYISSNLLTYSASGAAGDAGILLYTKKKELTLGLSVQNVGQVSNFSQFSSQEKLPTVYRGGLVYRFQPDEPTHFLVGADLEKPIDGDLVFHGGGEVWVGIQDFSVAFRAGYTLNSLNQDLGPLVGAALGAGVKYDAFEFNYAIVPFGLLGDTQRFSLTVRLGTEGKGNEAQKPIEKTVAVDIKPQISDYKTGTLKQATFDLKPQARTDIKNWTLEITDPKGNILRSYTGKGVPPKQIAWDGKDNSGNVVAGGIFANYNFRTEDTRGQQVIASEPIFKVAQASSREGSPNALASLMPVEEAPTAPELPENVQPLGMNGVIKVPSVSFAEKSSRINPDLYNYLHQVAKIIRKYPDARVYIEGHAFDEGNEREVLMLSQNRADEVLRYLVEKEKVSPDNLYSRGHAASAPMDSGDTEIARFHNRRVDIVILTK
ncbi:MAG TPA: PorV/PorQ family protein [bacterium]|nr:PorV/PorQ family protein [bacterium]